MRKIATIAAAAVMALALTGCGEDDPAEQGGTNGAYDAVVVDLPEGGSVTCVVFTTYRGAGVDCDWAGARR